MKVQTVQLGFSTPCRPNAFFPNVEHNSLNITPTAPKDTGAKQKQLPWTTEEDKLLIAGYLSISRASFVGASLWSRVVAYYNERRGQNIARNNKSCERRWALLNSAVTKFQEAYDQAEALKKGDESERDIFLAAHEIYETDMKKKFNLHHAWYLLKDDPKWKKHKSYGSSKITKIIEQPSYVSSPDQDTPSSSNVGDETVVPMPPSIDLKGAKRKPEGLAKPIPDLPECILEPFPKIADSEEKLSMIQKLVESQTRMAQALEENARAKKYKMFLQLEQRRTLSTRENAISEQLYAELFPN